MQEEELVKLAKGSQGLSLGPGWIQGRSCTTAPAWHLGQVRLLIWLWHFKWLLLPFGLAL